MVQSQNLTQQRVWQNFTPAFIGATENPVVTYSTQVGRFFRMGTLIFFKFVLVSTTMTKTTTTDNFRVSLPFTANTLTGDKAVFKARVENATPVSNCLQGEINSGVAYAEFRNYEAVATASAVATYAATKPGIGVLTNTLTVEGSGVYEAA